MEHSAGHRSFLVSSWDTFWHHYSQTAPAERHSYEIITEGSPCHLYFGALPAQATPRLLCLCCT